MARGAWEGLRGDPRARGEGCAVSCRGGQQLAVLTPGPTDINLSPGQGCFLPMVFRTVLTIFFFFKCVLVPSLWLARSGLGFSAGPCICVDLPTGSRNTVGGRF